MALTMLRYYTLRWKPARLLVGLFLSSVIGLLAYRRRSLNRSGIVGAVITGTTTFGLGGLPWGLALIYFFGSSSLLSHFRERDKEQVAADKFSKGTQRDLGQVLANGGLAALLALCYGLSLSERHRQLYQAGYVGTLATATADTWATELGVLSPQPPRLITTGQRTTPGTSGGISPTGLGAAALGALTLGSTFWLLQKLKHADKKDGEKSAHKAYNALPCIALISGFIGSLADSLLGATVQSMYYCPQCEKETERRVHRCGTPTRPLRGIPWFDNDVVNFVATGIGGLVAMLLALPCVGRKQRL
jgi:uncharacterized protein (TIGR00297 family)